MSRPQSAPTARRTTAPMVTSIPTPRPPSAMRSQTTDILSNMNLPRKTCVVIRNAASRGRSDYKVFENESKKFSGYIVSPVASSQDTPIDQSHYQYFVSLISSLQVEQQAFSSFSVFCEHALANAKVATENISNPNAAVAMANNSVEASVAAWLLFRLADQLPSASAMLMKQLLNVVFGNTFWNYRGVGKEDSSDGSMTMLASCKTFKNENDVLSRKLKDCEVRLEHVSTTLARQCTMMEGVLDRFDNVMLKKHFNGWRKFVVQSKKDFDHWNSIHSSQRNEVYKKNCFLKWVSYVRSAKARSANALMTSNHEALMLRIQELQRRCVSREEEIVKQRTTKEKYQQKSQRLEEMVTSEREAAAGMQARCGEVDVQLKKVAQLADEILTDYEKRHFHVASGSSTSIELDNVRTAPPTMTASSEKELRVALISPSDSGSSLKNIAMDNVKIFVVDWLNFVLRQASATNKAGETSNLIVSNLDSDLSDGRVLLQIIGHVYQIPLPFLESPGDRCNFIIKAAKYFGDDGGVTAVDIIHAKQSKMLRFCAQLLQTFSWASKKKKKAVRMNAVTSNTSSAGVIAQLTSRYADLCSTMKANARWRELAHCAMNYVQKAQEVHREKKKTSIEMALPSFDTDENEVDEEDARVNHFCQLDERSISELLPTFEAVPSGSPKQEELEATGTEQEGTNVRLVRKLENILKHHYTQIHDGAMLLAGYAVTDIAKPSAIDSIGWHRFASESKIVPKIVSKSNAEAIFKSLSSVTDVVGVKEQVHHMEQSKFCLALVKLFLARTVASLSGASSMLDNVAASPQRSYLSEEECVDKFRQFIEEQLLPFFSKGQIDFWIVQGHQPSVLDVLKQYRDGVLKKIFNEFAKDKTSQPLEPRMRMDGFVQITVKELKVLDTSDAQQLFASVRAAMPDAENLPGINYNGFAMLVVLLARLRIVNPLLSTAACVQQYIQQQFLPAFQFKLKIKV